MQAPKESGLHLAFAVDKSGGMLFNQRRVSKDSKLREELFNMVQASGGQIVIHPFSLSQFDEGERVRVSDKPWENAQPEDIVFVENLDPAEIPGVAEVTLFQWNRSYPSDLKSTFVFSDFKLIETKDFVGTSHECITMEAWKRQ